MPLAKPKAGIKYFVNTTYASFTSRSVTSCGNKSTEIANFASGMQGGCTNAYDF